MFQVHVSLALLLVLWKVSTSFVCVIVTVVLDRCALVYVRHAEVSWLGLASGVDVVHCDSNGGLDTVRVSGSFVKSSWLCCVLCVCFELQALM